MNFDHREDLPPHVAKHATGCAFREAWRTLPLCDCGKAPNENHSPLCDRAFSAATLPQCTCSLTEHALGCKALRGYECNCYARVRRV